MINRRLFLGLVTAVVMCFVVACSGSTGTHSTSSASGGGSGSASSPGSTASPGGTSSAQGKGCVSQDEAVRIWTDIDEKLNAVELDPKHEGVGKLATGQALELINEYLQTTLVSKNLTEKEVDKLESLTVIDAGCNGGDLTVQVSQKVVQDDYLRPDGQLDHSDSAVGTTLELVETFVRDGSSWKESDFRDATQPTSSPQIF